MKAGSIQTIGNFEKALRIDILRGRIPLELSLAASDVSTVFPPEPVHLLASRLSYLPLIARDIVDYFQSKAIEFCPDVWFTANGVVLKP